MSILIAFDKVEPREGEAARFHAVFQGPAGPTTKSVVIPLGLNPGEALQMVLAQISGRSKQVDRNDEFVIARASGRPDRNPRHEYDHKEDVALFSQISRGDIQNKL